MKLSKNFSDYEFKNAIPEPKLLAMLQGTRDIVDCAIKITDSIRTINEHIEIYKRIYGEDWLQKIPWKSRHLPCWDTPNLRAVDFKAIKSDGSFWKGTMLAEAVKSVAKDLNVHIGLGIGSEFIHLDVDRKSFTTWGYHY
jgi:hypothetical protein